MPCRGGSPDKSASEIRGGIPAIRPLGRTEGATRGLLAGYGALACARAARDMDP